MLTAPHRKGEQGLAADDPFGDATNQGRIAIDRTTDRAAPFRGVVKDTYRGSRRIVRRRPRVGGSSDEDSDRENCA